MKLICKSNLSKEERIEIGKRYFIEWNLSQYSAREIKEVYTDLNTKY